MRIAVLTSVHVPHDTRIYHRECQALAAAGYDIFLIAQKALRETPNNLRSIGVGATNSRLQRITVTITRILRTSLKARANVYHIHDFEMLPMAFLLRAFGKAVIYDVHEDTPRRVAEKSYLPRILRRGLVPVVSGAEWLAGHTMTAVIAATPQIAARFPQDKCTLVQNFPALEELGEIYTADYTNRPSLVAYVGSLAVERGLMEMLAAARLLPHGDAKLAIAGTFTDVVTERQARTLAPDNARLLGPQDRPNVQRLLARSRAGLALLHPITAYKDSQPLKLFEYMAAGLPVIASDFPYWRSMLEPHGCALFVNPLAPQEIADAIRWILANPQTAQEMGARGRRAVYEQYNWTSERDRLLSLYAQLAGREKARAYDEG